MSGCRRQGNNLQIVLFLTMMVWKEMQDKKKIVGIGNLGFIKNNKKDLKESSKF